MSPLRRIGWQLTIGQWSYTHAWKGGKDEYGGNVWDDNVTIDSHVLYLCQSNSAWTSWASHVSPELWFNVYHVHAWSFVLTTHLCDVITSPNSQTNPNESVCRPVHYFLSIFVHLFILPTLSPAFKWHNTDSHIFVNPVKNPVSALFQPVSLHPTYHPPTVQTRSYPDNSNYLSDNFTVTDEDANNEWDVDESFDQN